MDPDLAISNILGLDVTMAPGGNMGSQLAWAQQHHGPQAPTWSRVVVETPNIHTASHMAPDGSIDSGCGRTMDPDMAPGHSSPWMSVWP